MPEEELKGAFSDLPDGSETIAPPAPPQVESKEERPEPQEDMTKLLAEKERMAQEEREKRKAEVKKRKELEAEIERLKQGGGEDESLPDKKTLQETVKQTIHEETYSKEIAGHIRAIPGITRPLAEELDRTIKGLPKSEDPEADVRAAMAYLNAKKAPGSFTMPVVNAGFGGFNTSKPSVSPSAVRLGQEKYGLKADDFSKFGGEVKL